MIPEPRSTLRQVAALLGTLASRQGLRILFRAGMAVEDVRMEGNGSTPSHSGAQAFEISTPAQRNLDFSLMDDHNVTLGEVTRHQRHLQEEISRIIRKVDEIKTTVVQHDRRQVLIDGLHEELDQLGRQMTEMSLEMLSKESVTDIEFACVQSFNLSQSESDKDGDEEVRGIAESFEKLKSETSATAETLREEFRNGIDACTSDVSARLAKVADSESSTRRKII